MKEVAEVEVNGLDEEEERRLREDEERILRKRRMEIQMRTPSRNSPHAVAGTIGSANSSRASTPANIGGGVIRSRSLSGSIARHAFNSTPPSPSPSPLPRPASAGGDESTIVFPSAPPSSPLLQTSQPHFRGLRSPSRSISSLSTLGETLESSPDQNPHDLPTPSSERPSFFGMQSPRLRRATMANLGLSSPAASLDGAVDGDLVYENQFSNIVGAFDERLREIVVEAARPAYERSRVARRGTVVSVVPLGDDDLVSPGGAMGGGGASGGSTGGSMVGAGAGVIGVGVSTVLTGSARRRRKTLASLPDASGVFGGSGTSSPNSIGSPVAGVGRVGGGGVVLGMNVLGKGRMKTPPLEELDEDLSEEFKDALEDVPPGRPPPVVTGGGGGVGKVRDVNGEDEKKRLVEHSGLPGLVASTVGDVEPLASQTSSSSSPKLVAGDELGRKREDSGKSMLREDSGISVVVGGDVVGEESGGDDSNRVSIQTAVASEGSPPDSPIVFEGGKGVGGARNGEELEKSMEDGEKVTVVNKVVEEKVKEVNRVAGEKVKEVEEVNEQPRLMETVTQKSEKTLPLVLEAVAAAAEKTQDTIQPAMEAPLSPKIRRKSMIDGGTEPRRPRERKKSLHASLNPSVSSTTVDSGDRVVSSPVSPLVIKPRSSSYKPALTVSTDDKVLGGDDSLMATPVVGNPLSPLKIKARTSSRVDSGDGLVSPTENPLGATLGASLTRRTASSAASWGARKERLARKPGVPTAGGSGDG
ncbi:hypothetical protein HDU97_008121 [Phlyctochytrium planicorne]|nr:hypothetical protein HDU97_008121 [Phlyctochytrium planicorne]